MKKKWRVAAEYRMEKGEVEMLRIWKEYVEDLYGIDSQEQVEVHVCGYDGVQRGNKFGGEPQLGELRWR